MARTLSAALKRAVNAQETGEVLVALCAISHPSILNGPLRVASDLVDFVTDGVTYTAFPFQITLPVDTDEGRPTLKLVLDNIDRSIIEAIRSIPPSTPPTVQVDLALKSQPDEIEMSFPNLTLRNVEYDVFVVSGDLALDEDDREPIPAASFSPQLFPGLF
jgi:hypothetical protein